MPKLSELQKRYINSPHSNISGCVILDVESSLLTKVTEELREKFNGQSVGPKTHITIHISALPSGSEENLEFIDEVTSYLENSNSLNLHLNKNKLSVPDNEIILLNVSNPKLIKLNTDIAKIFNKYRNSYQRSKKVQLMKEDPTYLSREQLQAALEYGYIRSGKCFNPHITLAYPKVKSKNSPSKKELFKSAQEALTGLKQTNIDVEKALFVIFKDLDKKGDNPQLLYKEITLGR